eukprot:4233549-Pleurochrysis_carterae.AAC.1
MRQSPQNLLDICIRSQTRTKAVNDKLLAVCSMNILVVTTFDSVLGVPGSSRGVGVLAERRDFDPGTTPEEEGET